MIFNDLLNELEVSEHVEADPSPGECNTNPIVNSDKANSPLAVGTHKGQYDDVVLFSLIVVDRFYLYVSHSHAVQ